ncbi:MAG: hypothetical protein LC808_25895 [Actinobacteria bacterium]|nr:hypothetical protein [Actinomycetota bacterium]
MKNVCTQATPKDFLDVVARAEEDDIQGRLLLSDPKQYLRSNGFTVPRNATVSVTPSKALAGELRTDVGRRNFIVSTSSPGVELKVHVKSGVGKCTILTVK